MRFDVVVAGGDVVDGLGGAAVRADVGVVGDRIVALGDLSAAEAGRRIEAGGRIVAPGFVDIHSHSDFTLLVDPEAESALSQGVTTEIVGNCGHGCAPIADPRDPRVTGNIYGWGEGVRELDWRSVDGYLGALEAAHPAINVATLVPFGNLRLLAVGDVAAPARAHELAVMTRELEAGLDAGAVGLSTGLEYAAEANASGGELYALAAVVARRGRLYATHTRDRGLRVVEGTQEAIETTRATGARTQVAHILARRGSGGVEANAKIVDALEDAAADGLPIAWDVHTRLFGITNVSAALPPGSREPSDIRVDADDPNVISSFGRAGWDRTFVLEAGAGFADLADRSVGRRGGRSGLPAAGPARRGPARRARCRRSAPADGDRLHVHRGGHRGGRPDEPVRGRLGRDDDEPRRAPARPDAAAGVRMGGVVPAAHRGRARRAPAARSDQADHLAAGHAGRAGRSGPGSSSARRRTSSPSTSRRFASRTVRPATLASGVTFAMVNGQVAFENGRVTDARAGEVIRA